jgi:hypothetical protein
MGDWPTFFDWRCLEAKVLETTRAYLNIATAHVVLSSVHNICDDSEWSGDWEFVMKTARTNMTEAVAPCVDALKNYEIANGHWTNGEQQPCQDGFRSSAGIRRLNKRLLVTASKIKSQLPQGKRPEFEIVDAYALTEGHCEANFAGDRMHFVALIFDELELLLKRIDW